MSQSFVGRETTPSKLSAATPNATDDKILVEQIEGLTCIHCVYRGIGITDTIEN